MTRREVHFDAMLRHLGATYYQTLQGQATPSDVARALESVAQEAARRGERLPGEGRGREQPGRWRVRDVMTSAVISVDRQTPSKRIAELMSEHHVNALPVVTGGRKVAGVVSEADLLRTRHRPGSGRGLLRRQRPAPAQAHAAGQLMTSPAITIHPDAPIGAAARRMTDNHLTLLPVVDAAGELMGVVTRRDLLRVFLRPDEDIAAEVRAVLADVLLVDTAAMTVSVRDGVVSLNGRMERPELAPLAVRLVGDIDGVLTVVDNLAPAVPTAHE